MHGQDTQPCLTLGGLLLVAKIGAPFCTMAVTSTANGQICVYTAPFSVTIDAHTNAVPGFGIIWQYSQAALAAAASNNLPGCVPIVDLAADGDSEFLFGPGSTSAEADAFLWGGWNGWSLSVDANSATSANEGHISIDLYSYTYLYTDGPCCPDSMVTATVQKGVVEFTAPQAWTWSAAIRGSFWIDGWQVEDREFAALHISIPSSSGPVEQTCTLVKAPMGSAVTGWPTDGSYAWEASGSSSVAGTITAVIFKGDDEQFDRDGNGRYTQADVDSLAAIVGTPQATDPDELAVWDFDDSGEVDEDDVAMAQFAINAGIGAGKLGDLDQDDDTDCDDYDLLPASPDYSLGDVDYMAELDADLDGDNDAADRAVVYEILQPADWDDDGDVDYFDTQAFLAAFSAQEPSADLNGDLSWDFYDVQIWLGWVSAACP